MDEVAKLRRACSLHVLLQGLVRCTRRRFDEVAEVQRSLWLCKEVSLQVSCRSYLLRCSEPASSHSRNKGNPTESMRGAKSFTDPALMEL